MGGSDVARLSVPVPPGVTQFEVEARWHLSMDDYDRVKRAMGVDHDQRVFTEEGELDWCSFVREVDDVKVFVYGREDWSWPAKVEVLSDGRS